ncbi:MAG: hypothetical protein ACQEWG_07435 [Bacteroidota bacterium]
MFDGRVKKIIVTKTTPACCHHSFGRMGALKSFKISVIFLIIRKNNVLLPPEPSGKREARPNCTGGVD